MSDPRKPTSITCILDKICDWENLPRQKVLDRMIAAYINAYKPNWKSKNINFQLKTKRAYGAGNLHVEDINLDDDEEDVKKTLPPPPPQVVAQPKNGKTNGASTSSVSAMDLQAGFELMAAYYFKEADWGDIKSARAIFMACGGDFANYMRTVEGYVAQTSDCSFKDLLAKGPERFTKKSNRTWTPELVQEELEATREP